MSRRQPSSTEAGDLGEVARGLRSRIPGTFGDRFEVETLPTSDGPGCQREGMAECLVSVGESGRLETVERTGRSRQGREDASRSTPPLCTVRFSSGAEWLVRAVLESRIAAVALGTVCGRTVGAAEVEELPYPDFDSSSREQLRVLRRREHETSRDSIDWAIERVVAEAYRVELPELIAIQQAFSGTSEP